MRYSQKNFSVPLIGATTEEVLMEKRAAQYEAAVAERLKVRPHPHFFSRPHHLLIFNNS